MNKLSLTLAALLAASAASARDFESTVAESLQPFILEDSFAHVESCRVVDSVNVRPWTLEEARELIAPCAKTVAQRYAARIDVETGFVPAGAGPQPGLILKTELKPGSKQHRDLLASIERRGGRLLGHTAKVLASGETAPPAPQSKAVQAALSRCFIITQVRDLQSGQDFINYYGKCLLRDPELKLAELKPGRGLAVEVKLKEPKTESLTGFVTVQSGRGPVAVMIVVQ